MWLEINSEASCDDIDLNSEFLFKSQCMLQRLFLISSLYYLTVRTSRNWTSFEPCSWTMTNSSRYLRAYAGSMQDKYQLWLRADFTSFALLLTEPSNRHLVRTWKHSFFFLLSFSFSISRHFIPFFFTLLFIRYTLLTICRMSYI